MARIGGDEFILLLAFIEIEELISAIKSQVSKIYEDEKMYKDKKTKIK